MSERALWFTKIFVLVMLTVTIGVDIYLAANATDGDTISEITKAYSWRWASIGLAHGILTGHLFWGHHGKIALGWLRIGALCVVAIASVGLDVWDAYDVIPIIPVAIGVPLGRLLWPQQIPEGRSWFVWKR